VEAYEWNKEKILKELPAFTGIAIRSRIPIDKEIMTAATQLKFIARAGAGMENIDVPFAESKNIACLNAPEGNRDAVAEHCVMMLLALFNNLLRSDKEVRNGIWRREENRGVELELKTVGIIGYGNMGSAFAKRLNSFGAKILVYDKYAEVPEADKSFVEQTDMASIFEKADILSLHIPLTDETKYLVNDAFIRSFKNDIYIINTSRGKCLNTEDLVKHLKTGKVKGACLDVLEYETSSFEKINKDDLPPAFQYLCQAENVVLTPHIAGWTHESNRKISEVLVKKIAALGA
jgi:D-3-phosphoglycerate dehydrogenase